MSKVVKRSIGARLNEKGLEILSGIKKAVHIKPRRPVSMDQQFRLWMHAESARAAREGEDTYEEFTDFGVDEFDEQELKTQYELVFDPISGKEVLPAEKIWLDQKRAEWEAEARKKAKAERVKKEQESAIDDYVTKKQAQSKKQNLNKAPKGIKEEPQE